VPAPRIVLLHGVATTSAMWRPVLPFLDDLDVVTPDRPCRGDLAAELDALRPIVEESFLVGVSGGATLGLAFAASPVRLAGAILHEPAVGSLLPGLLGPVAAAYAENGVPGFGAALYGPRWDPSMASADPDAVARELPMFRAFEPAAAAPHQGPVLVTVGAASPPPRHAAASALHDHLGYPVHVVAGAAHFVPVERPEEFARLIRATHAALLAE
jgi:pimeloyl-ACP methyl ester carboxylesterase